VLAIVAILSAIAIPGLARFGAFSNDALSRDARVLYEMLSAARIYATTYNVRTAVVYNLDNYKSPQVNPNNDPLPGGASAFTQDPLLNAPVRFITSASIMYALPGSASRFAEAIEALKVSEGVEYKPQDAFYPVDGREGQWKELNQEVAVSFLDPSTNSESIYFSARPRYNKDDDSNGFGISKLGMTPNLTVVIDYPALEGQDAQGELPDIQRLNLIHCIGHVFTPDGRLETFGSKERYTFYVSFRPDRPIDQRLTYPEMNSIVLRDENGVPVLDENGVPKLNLQVVPIEIYRSTGRVKIAS